VEREPADREIGGLGSGLEHQTTIPAAAAPSKPGPAGPPPHG
jgi:hypothetical protein